MSSTPRSRYRNFNDLGSSAANRHSSYIPPSQPLDVLSLLTPSAKSKYSSSTSSSVTKTVYSVKTSDGSAINTSAPVKKNVFGRSSIYGALEAALATVEDSGVKNENNRVNKRVTQPLAESSDVVYRRKVPGRTTQNDINSGEENLERQKSMSLDVEEAFPSIRSRIQSYGPVKARATKRILPNAPAEEPKLTIRRVSFEHIVKPENVCLLKKESDDSGCDENFEESLSGTTTPSHRVASITSIDSLLGPGSPRTSSTSPDLLPRKQSNLLINPTLEEDKEDIFIDEDLKQSCESRRGKGGFSVRAVDLDDTLEFVTMEAPVKHMPRKMSPPDLVSDDGSEVFERKIYSEEMPERKISNTKLKNNDSYHVKLGGHDIKVSHSSKYTTTNHIKESKTPNTPSVKQNTTAGFQDSSAAPFHSNDKVLNKLVNNTKRANTTGSIPKQSIGISDRNSFYQSEKILDKKVRNTKPIPSDDSNRILFAESQEDKIGEKFRSNEKIMNKLINNTRRAKTLHSLLTNGPDADKEVSDKMDSVEGPKNQERRKNDRNGNLNTVKESTEDKEKFSGQFRTNENILNKFLNNTKRSETVASLPIRDKKDMKLSDEEPTKAKDVESFKVNDKILDKYIKNTKPPKSSPVKVEIKKAESKTISNLNDEKKEEEKEPTKDIESFKMNDKILDKYIKNTKPPKSSPVKVEIEKAESKTISNLNDEKKDEEKEPTKVVESFKVNDKILDRYIKNTKPPKTAPVKTQVEKADSKTISNLNDEKKEDVEEENDSFVDEFRTGGKAFNRLLINSKQWESSPALMRTENFKTNENSLDKYVNNTKPPKTVSTSPRNDKISPQVQEWRREEVAKDPLNFSENKSQILAIKKKTPPYDSGVKSRKMAKPAVPFDNSSPITPVSPLVAKIQVLETSPVSSSDESDASAVADWKKKIMSSQNLLQRGMSAPLLLRPLVATIMEGISDVSDTEDVVGDLPTFKSTGSKAKFGRQYSTPVQSPRKEQSVPLQPARRRKSQIKSQNKTRRKPPAKLLSQPEVELEDNFDLLDDLKSPVLQSPFKNAIRPNRRTTTSTNPVRLRQKLDREHKEQDEKENVLKRAESKNPGAVSHWKKDNPRERPRSYTYGARLAASAINGLQMKIDFASAARGLRKTEKRADGTAKVSKAAGEESCVESHFPEKMLLLLKGRKNVQCALVECKVSSLNSGDVFLLLHKDELFHFVGEEANVHEKAKGNDLVDRIIRNKEMGCTATKCVSLQEKDMDMCNRSFKRFFELLGGRPPIAEKESVIEDKEFEKRFQQEAKISVYEEHDEDEPSFVQLNTGKRLRYDILDSKKTFVLDFITEYYIWCGKGVPLSVRKKALLLAEEEYKRSVEECPRNPIVPPQGRRASVAMTAGALPSTDVQRRTSCASRGSVDMPSSVKLLRRTSSVSSKMTQRSISSDNVGNARKVSVNVNSRGSISRVNSETNLRRMSSTSTSSSSERRQSIASQGGRRMSTSSRRSSSVSNGRGSSSRRSSLMSTNSVDSSGQTKGRRVSVSMKQLRSLVSGSGKRMQSEEGTIQVERPDWGINTVTIQGKEPISLREKFSDWPEPGRMIKMKGHAASGDQNPSLLAPSQPLEPYDAELMHRPQPAEEVLKLEFTKLGRGRGTFKSYDEEITVLTDDVKVWLVHEYKNYKLPSSYNHMLYASEGYVVRWEYHLEVFDGFVRKHKCNRCAYYFWQGKECEINSKGATALMTVELDKEKGPQVRVVQNREPPSFLNLFNGKLVVRTDKRQMLGREPNLGRRQFPTATEMYVVRGECAEEGHLHQIEPRMGSLRSRGCFIVVSPDQTVYVWLGAKSTPHQRENAQKAGNEIEDNYISDNFRVVMVHESKEPPSFFTSLGRHEDYSPLVGSIDSHIYTPRLFRFDSTSGKFVADEILCKYRVPDRDTQFPFIQDDLYGASQPALFLLDAKYQLWLWQGWFETAEDSEKVTGSARQTFARNKKVAMETVNNYVDEMMLAENPKVFPIEAGYEPVDFISLFPFWSEREDVKRYGNKAIVEKGAGGRRTSINTAYKMLTRTEYTLEELQVEPKPEGVDPSRLEDYLSEEEFMKVFEMHREEFKLIAKWKQVVMKQRKLLY